MKTGIRLKQTDPADGTETILLETMAIRNGDSILYAESRDAKQKIIFGDEILLERKADVSSFTRLVREGFGNSRVESPWGLMELKTELLKAEKEEHRWMVEYKVYSGEDVVLHQQLEWEFTDI